jgi:hypothetical protein
MSHIPYSDHVTQTHSGNANGNGWDDSDRGGSGSRRTSGEDDTAAPDAVIVDVPLDGSTTEDDMYYGKTGVCSLPHVEELKLNSSTSAGRMNVARIWNARKTLLRGRRKFYLLGLY